MLALGVPAGRATIQPFTRTFMSLEDTVGLPITLSIAGTAVLQTHGFGGGTNGAGTIILAGGTDPFPAIFSGAGSSAAIITDSSRNPFETSLGLSKLRQPDLPRMPTRANGDDWQRSRMRRHYRVAFIGGRGVATVCILALMLVPHVAAQKTPLVPFDPMVVGVYDPPRNNGLWPSHH